MYLIKENEKWKTYQTDSFKILYRNMWSVSGDNNINEFERIYLITWEAEITIDEVKHIFVAPAEIIIPEKTSHKIYAKTDIAFLLFSE